MRPCSPDWQDLQGFADLLDLPSVGLRSERPFSTVRPPLPSWLEPAFQAATSCPKGATFEPTPSWGRHPLPRRRYSSSACRRSSSARRSARRSRSASHRRPPHVSWSLSLPAALCASWRSNPSESFRFLGPAALEVLSVNSRLGSSPRPRTAGEPRIVSYGSGFGFAGRRRGQVVAGAAEVGGGGEVGVVVAGPLGPVRVDARRLGPTPEERGSASEVGTPRSIGGRAARRRCLDRLTPPLPGAYAPSG